MQKNLTILISDAATAWNQLNGVVNIYKPAGKKVYHIRNAIIGNICKDLNQFEVPELKERILIEPGGAQKYVVRKLANLADHTLVSGPRYEFKDIKCNASAALGFHTSGVLLMGINSGLRESTKIHENRPLRVYHITGRFGKATENHFDDSRVTVKATFGHIKYDRLESMLSSLQASHQRKMFELCGVDIQSQTAYELASKGIIRPASNKQPVIYGIKLISFERPFFTMEVYAVNETEDYLATLVHEIAIEMRSVAYCSGIRCIRHGPFRVEDSLLRRHWTLEAILNNMQLCREIIQEHPRILKQKLKISPD